MGKYKVLTYINFGRWLDEIPENPEYEEIYESKMEAREEYKRRRLLNPQLYYSVQVEKRSDDEPNNRTDDHREK
tara:strand:+ start:2042 stop:2263 length:222 start_codon:yes stop_codon:yes gene_type:complete